MRTETGEGGKERKKERRQAGRHRRSIKLVEEREEGSVTRGTRVSGVRGLLEKG